MTFAHGYYDFVYGYMTLHTEHNFVYMTLQKHNGRTKSKDLSKSDSDGFVQLLLPFGVKLLFKNVWRNRTDSFAKCRAGLPRFGPTLSCRDSVITYYIIKLVEFYVYPEKIGSIPNW